MAELDEFVMVRRDDMQAVIDWWDEPDAGPIDEQIHRLRKALEA